MPSHDLPPEAGMISLPVSGQWLSRRHDDDRHARLGHGHSDRGRGLNRRLGLRLRHDHGRGGHCRRREPAQR